MGRLESKRGGQEQVGRAAQSPVDEHFQRGGSRGSAEWGKTSQSQQQGGTLHTERSGVMVPDPANHQPCEIEMMDTTGELANYVAVVEPTPVESSNEIVCATEEEIAIATAIEGSVKQALAAEFLSNSHHGYQYSADVEDGIYDAATEYITDADALYHFVDRGRESSTTNSDQITETDATLVASDVTTPSEDEIIESDSVPVDSDVIETDDVTAGSEDDEASKEGAPLMKISESVAKTGTSLVKSPPVPATSTTSGATTARNTIATVTSASTSSATVETIKALRGSTLVRIVMYFSSGSVPQYDINNLINSTQNKLNL